MKEYIVDPEKPNKSSIDAAADAIKAGLIVAFPTDTVYGLGVNLYNEPAITQVYLVKERPRSKALIAFIAESEDLGALIADRPGETDCLIRAFWPGPLTLIFKARPGLSAAVAGNGTIAVRLPANAVARELVRASGGPLATTSANISEQSAATNADQVRAYLNDKIEVLLDGGPTGEVLSTVVDMTSLPPRLIRQGAIDFQDVERVLSFGSLFPSQ